MELEKKGGPGFSVVYQGSLISGLTGTSWLIGRAVDPAHNATPNNMSLSLSYIVI